MATNKKLNLKYGTGMFVRLDDRRKELLNKIAEKDNRSISGEIRALIEQRAQEPGIANKESK